LDYTLNAGIRQYVVSQLLPCTPDSVVLGYSQPQYAWCAENEKLVFEAFLPLLYEQNPLRYEKLVNPGPNTPQFGELAPGRIADYVGLQIVRSYMQRHPEVTVASLLQQRDYRAIFEGANYKP
jgi:hypothetical protein